MSESAGQNAADYIAGFISRARVAQKTISEYTQEQVDELVGSLAWTIVKHENADAIAKLAFEESQLGYYDAKYIKLQKKVRGAYRDMKSCKSVGVVEVDEEKGLMKLAKPVGVIGAIVPCTNPEATPAINALGAIKGRNAIVFSPHPRTKKTNALVCEYLRATLKQLKAPEDLIISVPEPSLESSSEVMKQCDLVIATGGGGLVGAAYSSGTPAYGVGAGNAVVIVDETADLNDAARKIMLSKTFDYASSCSSDNSIIVQEAIYDKLMENLKGEGGFLCNAEEKARLQAVLFPEGRLNPKMVAQAPEVFAKNAELPLPKGTKFIMVEESGIGKGYPFSSEKLSVVLAVYKYKEFDQAIDMANDIHEFLGKGHSCGIHSNDEAHIMKMAQRTFTSRMMVRQATCYGNSGNWDNGMPFTLSLGCGTWGGNISSENITWKHMINTTWVSKPIPECIPDDNDLFGDIMSRI